MSKRAIGLAAVAIATLGLSACGDDSSASSSGLTVQTSFYPLQFVTERVAGDHATVANLTEAGGDPHALELSPRRVGELIESDLVVYLAGFQPAVDEAVDQNAADRGLDVSETVNALGSRDHEHDHGGEHEADHETDRDEAFDPHVWLDPQNMVAITEAVADRLAETDDANAEDYHANAEELVGELTALDDAYADGLASCSRDLIVVSHAAYGYLTERYGLEQVGVSGLDPEAEPSPQRIAEVQDVIRDEDVSTIFYERLVSPDVAETIADDLGVETAVLDPIEGLTDETEDETYLTLMEQNLDALRAANDCS